MREVHSVCDWNLFEQRLVGAAAGEPLSVQWWVELSLLDRVVDLQEEAAGDGHCGESWQAKNRVNFGNAIESSLANILVYVE